MAHGICVLTPPPIPGVEPIGAKFAAYEPRFAWDPGPEAFNPLKRATGATWVRLGMNWDWCAYPKWNDYDLSRLSRMVIAPKSAGFRVLLTTGYGHPSLPGASWKWQYGNLTEYLAWVRVLADGIDPDAMEFVNESLLPDHSDPVPTDAEFLHACLEFGQVVADRGILPVIGALSPLPPLWRYQDAGRLALLDRHAPIKWAISTHGYGSFVDIERQIHEARNAVSPTRKLWMTEAGIDLSKEIDDDAQRLACRLVQSLDDRYTTPFLYVLNQWEHDPGGRQFEVAQAFGLSTAAQLVEQWAVTA